MTLGQLSEYIEAIQERHHIPDGEWDNLNVYLRVDVRDTLEDLDYQLTFSGGVDRKSFLNVWGPHR